jgi:quercetin dioxygenase-like cupin family protein
MKILNLLATATLMLGCTHGAGAAGPSVPAAGGSPTPPAAASEASFTTLPPSARPDENASHPDPLHTDPDKYKVILENDQVRVLRYHDTPGAKTTPHYHRPFVLYALGPFRRRLVLSDGSVKEREFKQGDVIWMPAQIHSGENIGSTDTDVIIVESKTQESARD